MSLPKTDSAAIRQIIRAVRADGWEFRYVNDGEDNVIVENEKKALEAITAVDLAYLFVKKDGLRGYILFVLGNSPEEVAADYTVNLSKSIEKVTDKWL